MVPGTVIAERYRIVRLLGEGGMGAVYEGEHVAVGKKVAIKILHPNFAKQQGVVERFQREARAAAAIGHDNIIDVYDFGTHDGSPFMVMEYLRGETLSTRLERERKLPVDQACFIMGQVLSALGAAHAAGIVHRDLKPDNVFLIARSGNRDFVKLLDFGISKFNDRGTKSLTKTGTLLGTPYYMAPEQALAKPDVDGRADLYSAGVMLYEMLTGTVPFDADSEAEILLKIVQRSSEPLAPRQIEPSIPEELEAVVLRAIAFDRAARYQTAQEMLDALRPFGALDASPVESVTGPFRTVETPDPVGTPTAWTTSSDSVQTSARGETLLEPPVPRRRWHLLFFALGVLATVAIVGATAVLLRKSESPSTVTIRRGVEVPRDGRIELAGLPADARVWLDGAETPQRVFALRLGSEHRLRVEAPGHRPYETSFVVERSQTLHLALAPVPTVDAAAPPVSTSSGPLMVPVGMAGRSSTSAAGRSGRTGRSERAAGTHRGSQGVRPAGSLMPAMEEY